MIEVQVKVWRDYASAFEKFLDKHREFHLARIDATSRHSAYYIAIVRAPAQWDLFNALRGYGPLVDNSAKPYSMHNLRFEFGKRKATVVSTPNTDPVLFELECRDTEVAELVRDILVNQRFACGIGKKLKTRVLLTVQNGYEGLEQAKGYLAEFGLKLRKLRNKNVWLVKGAN